MNIRESYDSAAKAYVEHLFNELEQKPFDRELLDRFAEAVSGRGVVADLGCGPGHVAKYLHDRGVDVRGIDLSPEMIRCAIQLCPGIDETVHVDDLWGAPANLDFRFHNPSDVTRALRAADLVVTESVEREPYPDVEYPSRRCYVLATAA